jgi:hypothetical protein
LTVAVDDLNQCDDNHYQESDWFRLHFFFSCWILSVWNHCLERNRTL